MQNLEPVLIFTTVAEMGSFTRAADSLGIQKGRASMAARVKLPIWATVVKMRMGSRFCIFVPQYCSPKREQ